MNPPPDPHQALPSAWYHTPRIGYLAPSPVAAPTAREEISGLPLCLSWTNHQMVPALRGRMEQMKLPGGMNLQQMMQQAQKMQEQMAQEMEALRVNSSAGGGMVEVDMNGSKAILRIKIQPEATEDVEMLEDLLVAAINECGRKVDQMMQTRLGNALGGLNLPGLT
jgi:DNA-binding YbaB/EbfC family protein